MGVGTRNATGGGSATGVGTGAGATVGPGAGVATGTGAGATVGTGAGAAVGTGVGAAVASDAGTEPVDERPASRAPLSPKGRADGEDCESNPLIIDDVRLGAGGRTSGAEEGVAGEGASTGGTAPAGRILSAGEATRRGEDASDPATDAPADAEDVSDFSGFGSGVLSLSAM